MNTFFIFCLVLVFILGLHKVEKLLLQKPDSYIYKLNRYST